MNGSVGMPPRGQAEHVVPAQQVDPEQLLPPEHGYYTYDGSLTAPPCTEGVRWIVLKTALEVSPAQVARLMQLFPNNARPVQPLNGRVVRESRLAPMARRQHGWLQAA